MKPIYLFCLHGVRTGGPEALHQLSDALLAQGFDARLVYYVQDDINQNSIRDGKLEELWGVPREFPAYACPFEEYAHYRSNIVRKLDLSVESVIVLPETLAHLAPMFAGHCVLIWWLSLDNAFNALAKSNLNHLRVGNVRHAAQSRYAMRVTDALGLVSAGLLSDYTTDLSCYAKPLPMAERGPLALFNANHKVKANLDAVFDAVAARNSEISCQRIPPMPRSGLAYVFARARLYVDLGNFPGKDRGPREAMAMGCRAVVWPFGAGPETGAFVVGAEDPDAIAEALVRLMPSEDEPVFDIEAERETFFAEAKAVFSGL